MPSHPTNIEHVPLRFPWTVFASATREPAPGVPETPDHESWPAARSKLTAAIC